MFKFEPGVQRNNLKTLTESDVTVFVDESGLHPKKTPLYFNRDHGLNRLLITSILKEYVRSGRSVLKPVKCLDAIGSSGVSGLQWKKQLGDAVDVVINDANTFACDVIKQSAKANNLTVEVVNKYPCVLLHEVGFNFIFLDCYSDAWAYMDSAFKNIARNSILVITTKDDASIQASTPDAAYRRYSGRIIRTLYSTELGIRLVIASMARTAAKYNKAIDVLCCAAFKSSFTIAVMVQKGPHFADECLKNIRMLSHCMVCEDRAFHPLHNGFPQDTSSLLTSKCLNPPHTEQHLGPVWAGNIFDSSFVEGMVSSCEDEILKQYLNPILEEARCPTKKNLSEITTATDGSKRKKLEPPLAPPFYFNLHKHHPKVAHQKCIAKVITELREMGYKASKTHFDRLAIRTDAPLHKLYQAMLTE